MSPVENERPDVRQVLLVDDQRAYWRAFERLLAGDSRLHLAGAVADDCAACEWVERRAPDVVLIDVNVPEHGGFALTRTLRARRSGLAVVLISAAEQGVYRRLAGRAGALGFIEKGALSVERVVALLAGVASANHPDPSG